MRAKLNTAIAEAITHAFSGWTYRHGLSVYMVEGGFELPCVWREPFDLIAKTGNASGSVSYSVNLNLLHSIVDLNPQQKEDVWTEMESGVFQMLDHLRNSSEVFVTDVLKLKCLPDEYALTGYQTISMNVTFELTLSYCD